MPQFDLVVNHIDSVAPVQNCAASGAQPSAVCVGEIGDRVFDVFQSCDQPAQPNEGSLEYGGAGTPASRGDRSEVIQRTTVRSRKE